MATSQKDIAKKLNVSRSLVGAVLSGAPGAWVSVEKRKLIVQTARELGYRPNAYARATRSGRFGCVGVIQGQRPSERSLHTYTMQGIVDALAEHDYVLTLCVMKDVDLTDETVIPKMLRERMMDGVIVNYTNAPPSELVALLEQYRIPAIWLNRRLDHDCVFPDDRGAAETSASMLLELGHRRIEYCGCLRGESDTLHYSEYDRRDGFLDVIAQSNAVASQFAVGHLDEYTAYEALIRERLRATDRPTAVVTYAPPIANMYYAAALAIGLRVPEDLAIVTFGEQFLREVGMRVYTCPIPTSYLGKRAVDMVLQKIDDPGRILPPLALKYACDPVELPRIDR